MNKINLINYRAEVLEVAALKMMAADVLEGGEDFDHGAGEHYNITAEELAQEYEFSEEEKEQIQYLEEYAALEEIEEYADKWEYCGDDICPRLTAEDLGI